MSNDQNLTSHHLENVELVHQQNPITFSIPRRIQRENLKIGDLVKLIFFIDEDTEQVPSAERMWVEVKEIRGSTYYGTLDNDPEYVSNLQYGDPVEFSASNVAAIYIEEEELQIPYKSLALVSPGLVDKDQLPQYLMRKELEDEQDSGWRVFDQRPNVELQPDEFEEFDAVWVGDLIQQFMILDSVLDAPIGTRWFWNSTSLEYEKAD